jgi:hypothetical protein
MVEVFPTTAVAPSGRRLWSRIACNPFVVVNGRGLDVEVQCGEFWSRKQNVIRKPGFAPVSGLLRVYLRGGDAVC